MIQLPLTVELDALTQAIESAQAKCTGGRCTDPQTLARRVLVQVGRLEAMADAADAVVSNLWAHGYWWEYSGGPAEEGDVTCVELVPDVPHLARGPHLAIARGRPPSGTHNGRIYLHLKDRSQ